ncbi:LAMI_0B00254g1_1 [Lachancea mirantina]|uniref:LAMI_0B00254g1_1 n=1 Tax=Lachancea mirantina TaxID=1230905 RepID=A0A1G4ITC9_9SACH|nr:LAMI_0B00254g1_1 [Lachancea mirantina]
MTGDSEDSRRSTKEPSKAASKSTSKSTSKVRSARGRRKKGQKAGKSEVSLTQSKDNGSTVHNSVKHSKEITTSNYSKSKKVDLGRLLKVRNEEIEQAQHILGKTIFKLFKNGGHSKTFGLVVPSTDKPVTLLIKLTDAYPREPIKLIFPQTSEIENRLKSICIKNFNIKVKEFSQQGEPLVTQLNFLLSRWRCMCSVDYRAKDQLQKELMLQHNE